MLGGTAYVVTQDSMKAPADQVATMEEKHVQTAPGDHPEVDHDANGGVAASATGKIGINWKFESAGEKDYVPQTKVTAIVSSKPHVVGVFAGTCSEIGPSGGVDGKGLLAGELSGVQCWYAGGGNEIGLFAIEDGGVEIMVGELDEGSAENAGVRGNFKIRTDIKL